MVRLMDIQSAAIIHRFSHDGQQEVLLVTSRRTGRWVVPKGTVRLGEHPAKAAEREALEEAGIVGVARIEPIANFVRTNKPADNRPLPVQVFLIEPEAQLPVWNEMHQRRRIWASVDEAIRIVSNANMRQVLLGFRSTRLLGCNQDRA